VVGEQWLLLLGYGSMAAWDIPWSIGFLWGYWKNFMNIPNLNPRKIWNHPLLLGYYMIILEYEYLG
jgi:hypothetical protein